MAEQKIQQKARKGQQRSNDAKLDAIKTPPHSIEAEQSVLGGLMLDNEAWDKVSEKVIADDFYLRAHRQIFAAMQWLIERNRPIDMITVREALEVADELEAAGGFPYL